jgi:hypothetical protein
VNSDDTENRPVSDLEIPEDGMTVPMKKYGFVRVFHTVNQRWEKPVPGQEFPAGIPPLFNRITQAKKN